MSPNDRPPIDRPLRRTTIEVDRELYDTIVHLMSCTYTEGEGKVTVGEGCCLNNTYFNATCGDITIGRGSFFARNVMILTGSHDLDENRTRSAFDRHINIGEGVWIASGAIVLGPCTIGDRAVIGAGSVVTKDCEAGWVYVGHPAKKLRPATQDD